MLAHVRQRHMSNRPLSRGYRSILPISLRTIVLLASDSSSKTPVAVSVQSRAPHTQGIFIWSTTTTGCQRQSSRSQTASPRNNPRSARGYTEQTFLPRSVVFQFPLHPSPMERQAPDSYPDSLSRPLAQTVRTGSPFSNFFSNGTLVFPALRCPIQVSATTTKICTSDRSVPLLSKTSPQSPRRPTLLRKPAPLVQNRPLFPNNRPERQGPHAQTRSRRAVQKRRGVGQVSFVIHFRHAHIRQVSRNTLLPRYQLS